MEMDVLVNEIKSEQQGKREKNKLILPRPWIPVALCSLTSWLKPAKKYYSYSFSHTEKKSFAGKVQELPPGYW